jgi:hypothetical protein
MIEAQSKDDFREMLPWHDSPSPWWYDTTQFHELLTASGTTLVRDLISSLDGCTGGKAGEIIAAAELGRALYCKDITLHSARPIASLAAKNAAYCPPIQS